MTKEKQAEIIKKNIQFNERLLGQVVRKARENPGSWEDRTKALLVRKYNRLIRADKERLRKLRNN